jgi:hypothetical protein
LLILSLIRTLLAPEKNYFENEPGKQGMRYTTPLRDVAQVVARSVRDAEVAGSSPVIPTMKKPANVRIFYGLR